MDRARFVRLLPLLLLALGAFPLRAAHAQTVRDIAARGACSTSGLEGLSAQLVELHLCMFPDQVAELNHPNIRATSDRVHLLVTSQTRDALESAANQTALNVNSAFRTLADQYVLHHSGGCGVAAKPGTSNHQSGLAVDLSNWSNVVGIMKASGCAHPMPQTDPVHFDCPGPDMRGASVLVFQKLWNVNNPGDPIAEDGAYGPATAARVAAAPAGGFPSNGCGALTPEEQAEQSMPPPPAAPSNEKLDAAEPEPDVHGGLEGGCSVAPAQRTDRALPWFISLGLLVGPAAALCRRRR